jgi:hypothetical protein
MHPIPSRDAVTLQGERVRCGVAAEAADSGAIGHATWQIFPDRHAFSRLRATGAARANRPAVPGRPHPQHAGKS